LLKLSSTRLLDFKPQCVKSSKKGKWEELRRQVATFLGSFAYSSASLPRYVGLARQLLPC
jgi:hypothetical protein